MKNNEKRLTWVQLGCNMDAKVKHRLSSRLQEKHGLSTSAKLNFVFGSLGYSSIFQCSLCQIRFCCHLSGGNDWAMTFDLQPVSGSSSSFPPASSFTSLWFPPFCLAKYNIPQTYATGLATPYVGQFAKFFA